jgi:hypothetical protein
MSELQDDELDDTGPDNDVGVLRIVRLLIKCLASLGFVTILAWTIPHVEGSAQNVLVVGLVFAAIILGIGIVNSD